MINKTNLPIIILEALQPFLSEKKDLFKIVPKEDSLIYFADTEPGSKFYFSIKSRADGSSSINRVEVMPGYDEAIKTLVVDINAREVKQHFEIWIKRLERYRNVNLQPEDPIVKAFTDEYYQEFELIDDEASVLPLKTKQILALDGYLERVEEQIEEFTTKENSSSIKDIKEDISVLRRLLPTTTKAEIVKKLSVIWAKMTKLGVNVMKTCLNEAVKQGVQCVIKGVVENSSTILHAISTN